MVNRHSLGVSENVIKRHGSSNNFDPRNPNKPTNNNDILSESSKNSVSILEKGSQL